MLYISSNLVNCFIYPKFHYIYLVGDLMCHLVSDIL